MRLGALFSGGKDSTYAMYKAMEGNSLECLISIMSKNPESYMFHVPNISLTSLQAGAMGIPLITGETEGRKEEELRDLENTIRDAKERFGIEGIVTGAVGSVYQAERIRKICDGMGLECVNPLWRKDQKELLEEVLSAGFRVIVSGVFAYPLGKEWLGREIDSEAIEELALLQKEWSISPAGEGGEIETTVLDGPLFRKRIV